MMYDLFNRLQSTRGRVIKDRQIAVLKILLEVDRIDWHQLLAKVAGDYKGMANVPKTLNRDMSRLLDLGAIEIKKVGERKWTVAIRPQWPQEITESDFFEKIRKIPNGKTYRFLP